MENLINLGIIYLLSIPPLVALLVAMPALFPTRTQRAAAVATHLPIRAALVGFVNLGFFTLLSVGFFVLGEATGQGIFAIPGLLLLSLLLMLSAVGLGGVAPLAGQRLLPTAPPFRQTLTGALALTLAVYAPLIGWLILFPYLLALGLGALLLGFFIRPVQPGQPNPSPITNPIPTPPSDPPPLEAPLP